MIVILTAFALELLFYELLHYHRAVEVFVLLDDLLVVQPSNFQVVHSKVSYASIMLLISFAKVFEIVFSVVSD